MRRISWILIGFFFAVGIGCTGASRSPSSPGAGGSQKLNAVKAASKENLLSSPSTSSSQNLPQSPSGPVELKKSTASPSLQPSQIDRATSEAPTQGSTTYAMRVTSPSTGGEGGEGATISPSTTILSNVTTLSSGPTVSVSQNTDTFESKSPRVITGDSSSIISSNLSLAHSQPLRASVPAILPKDPVKDSGEVKSAKTLGPAPFIDPKKLDPSVIPPVSKDNGSPLPVVRKGVGLVGGQPSPGLVAVADPGGGVLGSGQLPGLIAPMVLDHLLKFPNENTEVLSVSVPLASLGSDGGKFPKGTIFLKTLRSSPCDNDCEGLTVRVLYFDQWSTPPFQTREKALEYFKNLKLDPASYWEKMGGSALYWDFPIRSSEVSFDSIPMHSSGVYLFLLKPSSAAAEGSKGTVGGAEAFVNLISETTGSTGLIRALQLVSTNADQGSRGL